ncbi:sulfur acquisition oxidoreductase, SfnB family [Jatrophihabitans endophyticus]|uniref:Sulfur acquisition oxidoreductase, SfnB family n=1 Tax=Jatrophihabitans endophyticus TaxID=1206085 RepID=A0A1M5DQV4_9ACTN|nr:acyl-CoA dehydrogenase family protein [Jatrophihabitans endophyticus]SHF69264.1 sulfur acquisition oxidoreductase, SfnB family [Jatrophihabitans endophyticus]
MTTREAAPVTVGPPPVLRDAAAAVAAAEAYAAGIADGVVTRDRAGAARVPVAELAAYDASGLLAITLPVADGGAGLGPAVLSQVCRTVAAVDPAIAQAPQGHYLFLDVLIAYAAEGARRRLAAEVLAGRRIANALAERGGGDAQALRTRLTAGRLSGRKYYATGALTAHWIAVSALDENDRLVVAFVEREAAGVTLDTDWDTLGQRATVSGSVLLADVAVDPELVLPYWRCFEGPQQLGARAQLYHASIEAGIAAGVLRDARWFVTEKARPFFEAAQRGWATRAADDPHVVHRFGVMATRVAAAESLVARAAATLEGIGLTPTSADDAARGSVAVAQAKAFASEVAVEVSSELFSLSGASATDEKYDLGRHWRNARTHSAHDPVDWKYHHVGAYLLDGVLPPNHGQL